jgi:hypothetical protein
VRQETAETGMLGMYLHSSAVLNPATNVGRNHMAVMDHGKKPHDKGRLGGEGNFRDHFERAELGYCGSSSSSICGRLS